jgi:hypothetical protein
LSTGRRAVSLATSSDAVILLKVLWRTDTSRITCV